MSDTVKYAAKKAKQHTVYTIADGTRVPGCTTITGVMDKPALVAWANKLGLQGIESAKYVDELATIGTLSHYQIECWLTGETPDLRDFTPNQLEASKVCVEKFHAWIRDHSIKHTDFALSEQVLVSEKHRFGGTVDLAAVINGKATLIDIKTAKGIYDEHRTQVAGGYHILCEENGFVPEEVVILRLGRSAEEGFEVVTCSMAEIKIHRERFMICRQLYDVNQRIRKMGGK